jgi:hypothetical protein
MTMQITDIVTITELSKLLGKSRPTVYKYVSDYEAGNYRALPHSVRALFDKIMSGETSKRGVFEYCDHWFTSRTASTATDKPTTLKEIIRLLKDNEGRLNLTKIKSYIEEELKK